MITKNMNTHVISKNTMKKSKEKVIVGMSGTTFEQYNFAK